MQGNANRQVHSAAAQRQMRRAMGSAAAAWQRIRRAVGSAAAAWQRIRRALHSAAARWRMRRVACCAAALVLVLLLGGDMLLPPQGLYLPELDAVQRQLRALTAGPPDGWRYSLRIVFGPGGGTLIADAARRDASGTWETVHTLWRPENGVWRMVQQTRQKHRPPFGATENPE